MPQQIHKQHPRPPESKLGKAVAALEKIQVLVAREDLEAIWETAERGIESATGGH